MNISSLCVCKCESADDVACMFRVLKKYNLEWNPDIMLGDASEAITARFT